MDNIGRFVLGNSDKHCSDTKLIITDAGQIGTPPDQLKYLFIDEKVPFDDPRWNYFKIGNRTICISKRHAYIDDDYIILFKNIYKMIETEPSKRLTAFLDQLRADGFDDAADRIQFNEYGDAIEDLQEVELIGKEEIERFKISDCRFFIGKPLGIGTETPSSKL